MVAWHSWKSSLRVRIAGMNYCARTFLSALLFLSDPSIHLSRIRISSIYLSVYQLDFMKSGRLTWNSPLLMLFMSFWSVCSLSNVRCVPPPTWFSISSAISCSLSKVVPLRRSILGIYFMFWDKVLLHSPDCLGAYSVDQAGLTLTKIHLSLPSKEHGLKACMPPLLYSVVDKNVSCSFSTSHSLLRTL